MRRRSHLATAFVALLVVGWSLATTDPRGSALAADPQTELARTQAELADAQAAQRTLESELAQLRAQIAELDAQLSALADEIEQRSIELADREALLQEHLRAAYERSRTSLLEVLLAADSLDEATTQVSYLLTVSDQNAPFPGKSRPTPPDRKTRCA